MTSNPQPSRRQFLQTSGAAVAGAAIGAAAMPRGVHAEGESVLKVGLIGCGGRGGGAAVQALRADPHTQLVAMADAFEDRMENTYKNLKASNVGDRVVCDEGHRFAGFDGYKSVIEASDVVLLCTPPGFRPMHMQAAVEAGKHIFCEKPVAVDAPGIRAVLEASQIAKKKSLNVVSGLCYRYQFAKQATLERIHGGEIGDITALQTSYNAGALWHRGRAKDWSEMKFQMRNWYYFPWLSGDFNVEQHVHSLDKIAWAMGDEYPVSCVASGGRIARIDPKFGNIYDHFNATYEWKSGVRCFSSCRQYAGRVATDVSDHVFGTKGTAHIQSHRINGRDGSKWRYRGKGPDDMYQNEHNELFAAIRKGEPINNGEYMCKSSFLAIWARMCAYTGQKLSWDEAWNSKEELKPTEWSWDGTPPDLPGEDGHYPIPRPGVTKFV